MRGIVCERVTKNRYRLTAYHYNAETPTSVYRRCEILDIAKRWQADIIDRQTAAENMFSQGTLKSFGAKIEIMILERADKWDSRTDA